MIPDTVFIWCHFLWLNDHLKLYFGFAFGVIYFGSMRQKIQKIPPHCSVLFCKGVPSGGAIDRKWWSIIKHCSLWLHLARFVIRLGMTFK
jgi:hypothetical protein